MRKYLFLVTIFIFSLYTSATAQNPISGAPEQDCIGAIPVCHGDYQQNQAYAGSGADTELTTTNCPDGNNGALGSGEKNGVWYVMNVVCNGYFSFTIIPNDSTDDYDWAVWNITGGGCSLIYNYQTHQPNAYPPYGGTCVPAFTEGASNYAPNLGIGGWTGLSQNPTLLANGQFDSSFYVTAGQTFVLLVSNFTSSNAGYHLTFDSSTACLYDTIKPTFVQASAKCGYSSNLLNVNTSVPVLCTSIAPNGSDFYITPPVPGLSITSASSTNCTSLNSTSSLTIQFSGAVPPGNYWLHAQNGSDNNTLVDFCTNEQSTSDSIAFTMVPPSPPTILAIDTPACNKARIIFSRGVKCSTVDPDGSDFQITGPDVIKVSKALLVSCNDAGLVDTVDIFFDSSIVKPGKYTLKIISGNDGNPITDTCGQVVVTSPVFYVSDGGVLATAYPNMLCYPGYFNLGAGTVMLPPPPAIANCGANGTVPGTNSINYQIGAGTTATKASPFGGNASQRRTRMLYTAAELNAAGITSGTFSQLAYNVLAKHSTAPFLNFTIKMGCTADTLLDTTQDYPFVFNPPLEIVYGPKSYSTTSGWNYFQLDNTYDWNSSQNLLVEICYSDTSSIGDDTLQGSVMPYLSYGTGGVVGNTVQGCALSSAGGIMDTARPNIQLVHSALNTSPKLNWVWTPNNYLDYGLTDSTRAYAYQTTLYTVTIIDKDYCYRRDTALFTVSVRNPHETPADTSLCAGNSVVLQAEGGASYLWYPTKGLSCSTCANPTVTIDTSVVYHVGIYDKYKCGDTLEADVRVNPLPVIHVSPKDTLALYQNPVQLQAYSPGARFYIWRPAAGLDNPDIPNPLAAPSDSTTLYTVTVIDTNNCSNTDSVTIRVYERTVEIPSAFTPNGDGKNDVFRIANLTSQKVAEFRVFNRWGQQVYSAEGNNSGWDGTFNGVEQGIGTYNYIIRVAFHDGSLKTFSGAVTLIR